MRAFVILHALLIVLLTYACNGKTKNGNNEKIQPARKNDTAYCIDTVINQKSLRIYPSVGKIIFSLDDKTDTLYYPFEEKYNIATKNIWQAASGKTLNHLVYEDYFIFSFADLGYLKHLVLFNMKTGKLIAHNGSEMINTNFPVFIIDQNKIITAEEPDFTDPGNKITVIRYVLIPGKTLNMNETVIQDNDIFRFHDFDTARFRRFLNLCQIP